MRTIGFRKLLSVVMTCVCVVTQLAPLGAQASSGVLTGAARSVAGAPVAKVRMQLLDAAGAVTLSSVTANDGGFNIPAVPYGMYTVQCIGENNRVLGTASVTIEAATTNVRVTCASEAPAAFLRRRPLALLAGLGAAAVAIGAVAVVAAGGDASAAR